jgi:hypothetical protein
MHRAHGFAVALLVALAAAPAAAGEPLLDDDGSGLALRLHLRRLRLEMYGDAGKQTALLPAGSAYYRAQPAIVLQGEPGRTSWFLGSGLGAAIVTPSSAEVGSADANTAALTTRALLGARLHTPVAPAMAVLQLDSVADHGASVMLRFALELR